MSTQPNEEPYGWWHTFKKLNELEADLEKQLPNPAKVRLIDHNQEYTPEQLRQLLQNFGSSLAILFPMEARLEAQCHALKETLKTGVSVAMVNIEDVKTIKDKEAKILADNDIFRETRRLQIEYESGLMVVQGWRKAYESAYATTSRLITLLLGEVDHTPSGWRAT